ncbi:ABC transporter [Sinomonas cellulolyticus]|uniref:ABC transporter ATP-binding protein n=1 Tax=Sinomonas cellulolyticus TaxID=2801916 RepID=A0ABS1JX95_9MICC|nr:MULTISPECIES: ABC transporter ATP-binding protein [Sinomonas]MBL0703971.1 ABC transporter ATP-binding protein [Sinomonas cellulolyticus]GHG57910.1 ABC transporter [Sinomonas sp. KCTC 49339]
MADTQARRSEHPVVLEGLTKRFRRTVALDSVGFILEPGEVFGYLGPNGAGKTTTIRLLMGMIRPTSGRARVFGLDVWAEAREVHRLVGYVPGEPSLYPRLTGREHVAYLGHLRGRDDTARARTVAERLGLDLSRRTRTLSRGNRQKLAIVLAVMSAPRLLVLDEPTSGLDPLVQREFHALLREHTADGGSVLLSSHILGEVQRVADRIGVVREGRLVAVERLADLSGKSLHHIRATFADAVRPDDFAGVTGVRGLTVDGQSLTCSAPQSALDDLLKRVSAHRVIDFECAEAELDEMFLTYYGGESDALQRVAQDAS